jgi:L,D-transpeptidase catalytic domain
MPTNPSSLLTVLAFVLSALLGSGNARAATAIVVSVRDQALAIVRDGEAIAQYPVSTSKFGLGDRPRSFGTPLGALQVAAKIGGNAPQGAVFKNRHMTGEVLRPDAIGRDPIVTRILHLRGLENSNANAFGRGIYIHGTAAERSIGRPASYGCIRMRSRDVVKVFDAVAVGARVEISKETLRAAMHETQPPRLARLN